MADLPAHFPRHWQFPLACAAPAGTFTDHAEAISWLSGQLQQPTF